MVKNDERGRINMAREPRFPGIDWYCDHCGALLNTQRKFDDHKYTWKCTECGFKNSISWDNISSGDSAAMKFLLHLIGFLSYIGFWTGIMLAVAMFVFHADRDKYFTLFLASLGLYAIAFILDVIIEFGLRHSKFSIKNLIFVIFRNLKEDLLAPLMAIKEIISNLLSFITRKLPRKYVWHSNKGILAFAIMYLLIIVAEFIALSRIIGFGLSDWSQLITTAINSLRH